MIPQQQQQAGLEVVVTSGVGFFFPSFSPFDRPQLCGPEVPAPMAAPGLDLAGGRGGTASSQSSLQF